ncbi:hypothetical protein PhaeoP128_00384 [Phaeobacter gallaeciensis]|nr:hypothetical protein PhaeoP129_00384 [Phaeobacter gallaeciensis]ATF21159.1 hypothetical protein PhaeoP128_00384 [Phaeobacter gallaeciensis]
MRREITLAAPPTSARPRRKKTTERSAHRGLCYLLYRQPGDTWISETRIDVILVFILIIATSRQVEEAVRIHNSLFLCRFRLVVAT